jgi:predicted MFS family arabinose efflux permease
MAAVAIGTALATAAAGILGQLVNWRIVFALSAALALVCLIPLWRLAEPKREGTISIPDALRKIVRHKWALLVFGLAFVEGGLVLGILTLLAPALESQGIATSLAGLSVAAYGLGTLVFSRFVGPLTRRISAPRVVALGGLFLVLGLGVVASYLSVATVVIAAILLGGAWAFMHTGLQSWATQVVPEARGMTVAFFAGALFAGSAISSALAGPLAEAGQWTVIFGAGATTGVVLTIVAVVGLSRYWAQR